MSRVQPPCQAPVVADGAAGLLFSNIRDRHSVLIAGRHAGLEAGGLNNSLLHAPRDTSRRLCRWVGEVVSFTFFTRYAAESIRAIGKSLPGAQGG